MIEAYPLCWPDGWSRTKNWDREVSRFRSTFAVARDELLDEVDRLRGRYYRGGEPILSTNVGLRRDGLPYANQRDPDDPGVVIYFEYRKQQMCFACDKYRKVWENMVAIRKTIEAIRGMERWGASDMMERAFRGFVSLTDQSNGSWWSVLGVSPDATINEVESAYKVLRSKLHPDKPGGNSDLFVKTQEAFAVYKSRRDMHD